MLPIKTVGESVGEEKRSVENGQEKRLGGIQVPYAPLGSLAVISLTTALDCIPSERVRETRTRKGCRPRLSRNEGPVYANGGQPSHSR